MCRAGACARGWSAACPPEEGVSRGGGGGTGSRGPSAGARGWVRARGVGSGLVHATDRAAACRAPAARWPGALLAEALLQLGELVLDPVGDRGLRLVAPALLGRELEGAVHARLGERLGLVVALIAQIEDVLALVAAGLALLVADHVDEPHAEALGDLDLAKPRRLLARRAALDERLTAAHDLRPRPAVEEHPHAAHVTQVSRSSAIVLATPPGFT